MAIIYADENVTHPYNATDATKCFYNAIQSTSGSGDTLVFRDMGTSWKVSPVYRMGSLTNFDIIFENGFVLEEITTFAAQANRRQYNSLANLLAQYPNGSSGTHWDLNEKAKLFWTFNISDINVTAYGAEFIGTFPTVNIGNDPAITPGGDDNSYEFGHWFQADGAANLTWKGGYVHNWAGDGFNVIKMTQDCLIEDVKTYYNKRLGIQSQSTISTLTINDSDISFNGRGQNPSTEFGTNTGHGNTWEPNLATESVKGILNNCRIQENRDSGIGIHAGKSDNSSNPVSLVATGIHFEDNGIQADGTRSSAITCAGTDIFTNPTEERGQDPLGGLARFVHTATWGDTYGFLTTSHYKGSYALEFEETVVYKVSTNTGETNPGTSIIDMNPRSTIPNGSKVADVDFGNFTVVHELDEYFIDLQNFSNIDEIENTVIGNVHFSGPGSKGVWTLQNAVTNNSNIQQTRYALGSLPANTVNVQATINNAVKSTSTNGEFTFTRTGSTVMPMAIKYSVNTTGTNVEMLNDFKLLRGSVVIPTGQSNISIPVVPLNSDRTGGNRNITLTIDSATDLYTIGTNNQATVILSDFPTSGGSTTQLNKKRSNLTTYINS